jgi:hypothetical protein
MNWSGIETGESTATDHLSRDWTCLSFVTKQSDRNGLLKMPIFIFYAWPFV